MFILKQLRRKKNISQTDLAKEIGVSLRTIQLYEKREANIPIKNLNKIAAFFDLSIAELYLYEVNEEELMYSKKRAFSRYGNIFYPLDYGKFLIMAPLLAVEQQKGFVANGADKDSLKDTFQIGFIVDFIEDGAYLAFEVSGDSMNDGTLESIPNKTIVLGLLVEANEMDAILHKIAIVVCKDRIICKRITGYNAQEKTIYCESLNKSPEYSNFEVQISDIIEVYHVVKKQMTA